MRQRHTQINAAGSLHFVTTVTRIRGFRFIDDESCNNVLRCFEHYREKCRIDCVGYVLMPDHFHALLFQLHAEPAVSDLMQSFKQHTSGMLGVRVNLGRSLWKAGYDDVAVPSGAGITKLNYLHDNPVRAGFVTDQGQFRWSSIHDYLGTGKGIVTIRHLFT